MSPYLVADLIGTEELLDLLEAAIIREVNEALATVYERRVPLDQARAELRGEPYVPLQYEEIPVDHVWTGNFPSTVLEEVGPEEYPYIAITLDDYIPDAEDLMQDHRSVYRNGFTIHSLAQWNAKEESAEPLGHSNSPADLVLRRAVRMAEAVHLALNADPVASRLIDGGSNPTRGQHSLPWTYQREGVGPNFWFQAVGTTYAIKSYTSPWMGS
jgi:hypothetical protein